MHTCYIFSDTIYSRLATEYKSLVLASVNCFDDFIGKKKHVKTDDAKESSVKNNVGVCSRNVSDQKPCCKVTEVDKNLNDVSLNDECRTNNSHCRYVYLISYTRRVNSYSFSTRYTANSIKVVQRKPHNVDLSARIREKHYYYEIKNLIPKGVKHIIQTTFFNIKKFKNPMNSARCAIELG